jgi:hypothetical protein
LTKGEGIFSEGFLEGGVGGEADEFFAKDFGMIGGEEKSVFAVVDYFGDAVKINGKDGLFACHFVNQCVGHVEVIGLLSDAHDQSDVGGGESVV